MNPAYSSAKGTWRSVGTTKEHEAYKSHREPNLYACIHFTLEEN